MKKTSLIFLFIFTSFIICSCATYTKRECSNFDWKRQGHLSALKGNVKEKGISHYYRECNKKYGIKPHEEQFSIGYQQGLKVFCTPAYAEKFADKGGVYEGTCSKKQENVFLKPYVKGINIFYKNRVSELESEVHRLENEVHNLENEKSILESDLDSCRSGL